MRLTEHEQHTALWRRIEEDLHKHLDNLRKQNDGNLNESATSALRGRIAECKRFLAMGEPIAIDTQADDSPPLT
jgi:hypothetical protein